MNYAAANAECDPKLLAAAAPDGLSRRQAIALHHAEPEEREAVLQEAAATGDLTAAMQKLTQSLRAAPPETEINAGEVAETKASLNDAAWHKRHCTTWINKLKELGVAEETTPLLDKVLAIAVRTISGKPSAA